MTKLDPSNCIYSEVDAIEVGPFGIVPYYKYMIEHEVGCCLNWDPVCDLYNAKINHE